MATKKCANCGTELSEEVNFCPKCGAAVDSTEIPTEVQTPEQEKETKKTAETKGNARLSDRIYYVLCTLRIWSIGLGGIAVAAALLFPKGYIGQGILLVIASIAWIAISYRPIKLPGWIIFVIGFALVSVFAISPLGDDEAYIEQVRAGVPADSESQTSYGSALSELFNSEEWSCERNTRKVTYEGKYEREGYGGGIEDIRIVFSVDPNNETFAISQVYVNGEFLEEDDASGLIYAILFAEDDGVDINRELSLIDIAHVAGIWGGKFYDDPDITVYEAFDGFFTSGNWDYDGDDVVTFSGKYKDGTHEYDIDVHFLEGSSNTFSISDIVVDGIHYDDSYAIDMALEAIYGIQDSDLTAFVDPDDWYKEYEEQTGYYLDTSTGWTLAISYIDGEIISVSDEGGIYLNRYNGEYTQERDGKYVYSSLSSPGDEYMDLCYDQTDGSLTTMGGVYFPMMGHGDQYTIPANFDKNWCRANDIFSRSYSGPYGTATVSGYLDDWIDVTTDDYGFCSFDINDYEGAACGGVYYRNDEGKELYYYPDFRLILFVDSSGGCLVGRDN